MKLVYLLAALAFLKCLILYKVFHSMPPLELKRRARSGDKRAQALFRVCTYERSLDVLLWLAGTASAAIMVIWSARTSWWLAVMVMAVSAWLLVWARFTAWGWAGAAAAFAAPYYAAVLSFLEPALSPLAKFLAPDISIHTGMYEKKDLQELLISQNRQQDNRISESDLKIAYNALEFGQKTVGQVMTPLRQVKMVGANENIGPLLMDELHKSGFSRFPVVKDTSKSAAPQIVGTLHLNSLIGYEGNGKVKDLAENKVYFINEDSTLDQALSGFLKTHHHLMVVVNSFEETVGVLALEDVIEQILGKQIIDEFDNYADLRAVASRQAGDESAQNHIIKPEQSPQSVVK